MKGIYKIRNIINGKIYIGSTVNFDCRWKKHKEDLCTGKHHSKHLQQAWHKYGKDSFVFESIEEIIDDKLLFEVEQSYFDKIKPWDPAIGYNMSKKAGGGMLMEPGYFTGIRNPMFGKSSKDILIKKHGEIDGLLKWEDMNKARSKNGKGKGTIIVQQFDLAGNLIAEYKSVTEAGRTIGKYPGLISLACRGSRKSAYNFIWKFKNNIIRPIKKRKLISN